jgi:hypothetical protein
VGGGLLRTALLDVAVAAAGVSVSLGILVLVLRVLFCMACLCQWGLEKHWMAGKPGREGVGVMENCFQGICTGRGQAPSGRVVHYSTDLVYGFEHGMVGLGPDWTGQDNEL